MIRRNKGKSFWKDSRGAQAVEFALISPLFFATIFGTFEFGRALYEKNRISAAASAGARAAVISGAADDAAITAAIHGKLSNYDLNKLTITLQTKTIAGEDFKKISISYSHDYIVSLGQVFHSTNLTSTRYIPSI